MEHVVGHYSASQERQLDRHENFEESKRDHLPPTKDLRVLVDGDPHSPSPRRLHQLVQSLTSLSIVLAVQVLSLGEVG